MKLLSKLFSRKAGTMPVAECPTLDDEEMAELVRVYDSYGRELAITRDDWRDNVLLGSLEAARQDPDQLYDLLISALHDGFVADVLPYAEHLRQLDKASARAATLLGTVYLQLGRLDDAERVLTEYVEAHGEDGYLLTNLAKVYAERGERTNADATLWRALELDPNQENAVAWFLSLAHERGRDRAVGEGLRKLASLPRSWRARLWLARAALEKQNPAEALRLYDEALLLAPTPLPAELLMQLGGDLGNHGHLVELLERVSPRFVPAAHGLEVGINLIKANVELGRLDHARAVLNQLYSLQRPDYHQALSYWDTEIAAARIRAGSAAPQTAPAIAMLRLTCPIWLDRAAATADLFPIKADDAVMVGFLGGSANKGESGAPRQQQADTAGRITRALSLFLGEQFQLHTDGVGIVLQPFVHGHGGGLVLAGKPWPAELACQHARQGEQAADYAVVTHLDVTSKSPTLSLRVIRTIDATVLESCETLVDLDRPEAAFVELTHRTLDALQQRANVAALDPPSHYRAPTGEDFADYQLRLEQLLAATACELDGARTDFLNGEREMLMGTLELCLRQPDNATPRFLLARLLERLQAINPQVVREFRDKVERLQAEHPLPESVQKYIHARLAATLN